jgi:hypothetical protein
MSAKAMAVSEMTHIRLAALRADLLRALETHTPVLNHLGILMRPTAANFRSIYWNEVRRIMKDAYIEPNAMGTVPIQCPQCKQVNMVMRDVLFFSCKCSPHTERFTHQCRKIEL